MVNPTAEPPAEISELAIDEGGPNQSANSRIFIGKSSLSTNYLVISQVVPVNPAAPVKGPTHVVKRGKTPVLNADDARKLLESIPTNSL